MPQQPKPQDVAEIDATKKASAFVLMSDVEPQQVQWLWEGRIALGELTVLDGLPGTNKSSFTLDIAARVTTGSEMPDGTPGVKGGVLLMATEDSLNKTLPNRLKAAGADMSRVAAFTKPLSIPKDLNVIEETAFRLKARLLVIDPLMCYLGRDSNNDQAVRQALMPLRELAERANMAVLLVRHLNKSGNKSAMFRGSGSIGIIGTTRSGLLIGHDPEDPNMRVLCQYKNNLGPIAPSMLFEPISDDGTVAVRWRGDCDYLPEDLLTPASGHGHKLETAKNLLMELLANGPVPQTQVEAKAAGEGISKKTLERAKTTLGVVSDRKGFGAGGIWVWTLPVAEEVAPQSVETSNQSSEDHSQPTETLTFKLVMPEGEDHAE